MVVRKRDGRLVLFDESKIFNSIKKAALAIEGKDDDLQERARQIMNIKLKLISAGFDPDEAEEQAEQQFQGYIENEEYTEFDEDEAYEAVDMAVDGLDNLGQDIVETDEIQDFVEKALMLTGHSSTAREYIIHRANRERIREMNTSLMRSFEDLTFGKSEDVETKRENANIDGDSSMGTMLKYGSEGAKKFNLLYVIPPEESEAHSNGDIHIHDLDFYSLTETCVSEDTKIVIRNDGSFEVREVAAESFNRYLNTVDPDEVLYIDNLSIWSQGKFVKLKNCVRHSSEGKQLLSIRAGTKELKVTTDHRIPVIRDGEEHVVRAGDILIDDQLIVDGFTDTPSDYEGDTIKVTKITEIEYTGYVYDFETENHYFSANGIKVHNCVQTDLEKLFKGGFNTGHGFLREPGEIRSYAALACISIQSSQNDMHKSIA